MREMRRDIVVMLYWALRWHEGRRVSYKLLCDVLWGEFALPPQDPAGSLHELIAYVQKRHGDKWLIEDSGRAFRIQPRIQGRLVANKPRKATRRTMPAQAGEGRR